MAVARYNIEKFDRKEDFTFWKAKIKAIIDQQKTFKALWILKSYLLQMTHKKKETMKNATYVFIILNLRGNVLRKVIDKETTYGMWKKLDELYQFKDLPNCVYMRERFFTFKMDSNKSLIENLGEFKKLSTDFKDLENKIGDENESFILLNHFQMHLKKSKWLSNMEIGRQEITIDDIIPGIKTRELEFNTQRRDKVNTEGLFSKGKSKNNYKRN